MKLVSSQPLKYDAGIILAEFHVERQEQIAMSDWLVQNKYFYEFRPLENVSIAYDVANGGYRPKKLSRLWLRCTEVELTIFVMKFG